MNTPEHFEVAFLKMFDSAAPDRGMYVEIEPPVVRYMGEGEEPFSYSIMTTAKCSQKEFTTVVSRELRLAKSRNRASIEWKTFEFQNMHFQNEILKNLGFKNNRRSSLLYLPSSSLILNNEAIDVRQVKTPAEFDVLLRVNERAFGQRSDWLNSGLRYEIIERPDQVKAYVAFIDGKPASAGWVKIYNKVAFLFGGGTDPKLRGRGAYRALTSARTEFARQNGADFTVSEASSESEKILRALQFIDAGAAKQWVFE